MRKIKKQRKRSKEEVSRLVSIEAGAEAAGSVNGRIELIQQLIPLGLEAVNELLQAEVKELVGGASHQRTESNLSRWGSNPGSIYLAGQKVSTKVPRVRDLAQGQEVPLESYQELRSTEGFDEKVFSSVVNGLSCRKYEAAAELVPEAFGMKKSSVSRSFKRATAKHLQELCERDLSEHDMVAVFIDGKHLGESEVIIALGVTLEGEKIVLGFIESSTENGAVCKDFMRDLKDRGLNTEQEILFVIDGSKGLAKGIQSIFGEKAIVQRCQWHKRENVLSYLPKKLQSKFRAKLQAAYEQPTYAKAKARLVAIAKELQLINESAVKSLEEGLEQTLTLHRLGVFKLLGISFKTTNCIENLNRQVQRYTNRICNWKNSNQRQRWVASSLLEIEQGLRKVKGRKHLPLLRKAMVQMNKKECREAA